MATQYERELLVSALLDITITDFRERARAMTHEEVNALAEEVDSYAGQYFSLLEVTLDEQTDQSVVGQLLAQAIASMSDDTLHGVVKIFGKDPLANTK